MSGKDKQRKPLRDPSELIDFGVSAQAVEAVIGILCEKRCVLTQEMVKTRFRYIGPRDDELYAMQNPDLSYSMLVLFRNGEVVSIRLQDVVENSINSTMALGSASERATEDQIACFKQKLLTLVPTQPQSTAVH